MPDKKPPFRSHPFWEFSLKVYGQKAIETECLNLQNNLSLNVNLLLFSAWQAYSQNAEISLKVFQLLQKSIGEWHSKVESIRSVRESLKNFNYENIKVDAGALDKVKNIELASEYIEQTMLAAIKLPPLKTHKSFSLALIQNFRNYLLMQQIPAMDTTDKLAELMIDFFDQK